MTLSHHIKWRKDKMPMDGTVIYRRVWSAYRFQPYSPKSQEFKRGQKGRWQEMTEYGGWQNCNHPLGDEWCSEDDMQLYFSAAKPGEAP